jgi:cell division protein FtsI (penicillin-binding protein 3)
VESVIDDRGEETPLPPPPSRKVVEPTTAHQVLRMMEGVTTSEEGTAGNVNVPGYVVGGKTGTANRVDDTCGCYRGYTSSFIGVAPAKDPKVVTAVIIQDPKGAYMGSSNGVPVFNEVMAAALQTVGAPPDTVVDEPLPVFATSNPDKAATMRAAEGR